MSEILPSPQNEPQTWKQELQLHPEGHSILRPEETLAIIGSWTEQKIEDAEGIYKDSSEDERERQTRVLHVALGELPNLDIEFGVPQAVADRRSDLEGQLREANEHRNVNASVEIRTKLAGLDFLLGEYDGIEDNIKLAGNTSKEKSTYVNELITEHNEWVSRGSKSIADSPEMREAQERINARYAEQANQQLPTETVDDARQKVAEAFGDISDKEREVVLPEDERERTRFVKEYFAQHSDVKDAKNEAVLKEFIRKETQFRVNEVKRLNRPGLKAVDSGAMIFRIGAFNNSTLEELAPELRFTYKLLADKKPGLSYSEFNDMSVDEIALTLGIDVRKDIDGYNQYVKKGQKHNMQFPNIDK